MTIHVTKNAITELKKLDVGEDHFLRVSVIPGGCSGMTYTAAVDSKMEETDEVVHEEDGVRIIADEGSASFLTDLDIDYSYDLVKSGFQFRNPHAKKSCGCGASFAT